MALDTILGDDFGQGQDGNQEAKDKFIEGIGMEKTNKPPQKFLRFTIVHVKTNEVKVGFGTHYQAGQEKKQFYIEMEFDHHLVEKKKYTKQSEGQEQYSKKKEQFEIVFDKISKKLDNSFKMYAYDRSLSKTLDMKDKDV